MKNKFHTIMIESIDNDMVGEEITVSGWVQTIRDHGGVLFLDLRDTTGVLQTVSNDDELFKGLSRESVIKVSGKLRSRSKDTINEKLKSGKVELLVETLEVLSESLHELPFEIMSSKQVQEDIRLKYRYLDMRNEKVKSNILLRSDILHFLRNKMHDKDFTEVQTPILTASSPEGARDFVVPSRKFKGKFYALPQAPQIYKELLMVGGIAKYFQIAPCFRDEDSRADRTLEFYQLDLEMSFVEEEDVLQLGEDIFYDVFSKFSDKKVSPKPFKRFTYEEAMDKYGSDKPDLRNPLIIEDISELLKDTTFGPFKDSTIKAINVDGIGDKSNSWFNEVVDYASSIGMPGIGYLTLCEDGTFKGPIDKFLSDKERKELIKTLNMKSNSVVFFIAEKPGVVETLAGKIRQELAVRLDLIEKDVYKFCWIVDFPMYELNDEGKLDFCHNPFSMPQGGMDDLLNKNPLDILAYQYDIVCNGIELSSGAVRNHNPEIMIKAFEIAGYDKTTIEKKFPALFNAFHYGAPPHAGVAPGVDRMIMLMQDEPSIREVIAFPMNSKAQDLLMGAPGEVTEEQLREVHIKIRESKK